MQVETRTESFYVTEYFGRHNGNCQDLTVKQTGCSSSGPTPFGSIVDSLLASGPCAMKTPSVPFALPMDASDDVNWLPRD